MRVLFHLPSPESLNAGRTIYYGYRHAFEDLGHAFGTLTQNENSSEVFEEFKPDIPYLLEFLTNKTENSLQNNYLLFTTSIYLYPLIFYLIWLYAERYFKKQTLLKNPLVALIGITILIDIFFIDSAFDLVFLTIPILWGGMLFYLKKESKESYKVALGLLILCPILQILGQDTMVEKAASWAFLALTVGVIMNVYELKKHPEEFEE